MSINPKSYQLAQTKEGIEFAAKNNLKTCEYEFKAGFFNEHMLITIYDELGYLQADYYDLKNLRWRQNLDNKAVANGLITSEVAREIYKNYEKVALDSILSAELMARFYTYLKTIDLYMQDFLAGDFSRYEPYLKDFDYPWQKGNIEAFKFRQFQNK